MLFNLFRGPSSKKLFNQGFEAYKKGDHKKAVDKLSQAIQKEKERTLPDKELLSLFHTIRGEVYLSEGVAVLSQSDFAHALDHNPENASALNNMGIWFSIEQFNTPDYKRSLEYMNKAIALKPGRKDFILNRAVIKIKSGDTSGCNELKELEAGGYADAKLALEKFCNEAR